MKEVGTQQSELWLSQQTLVKLCLRAGNRVENDLGITFRACELVEEIS